jgi:uncharacterized protein (TIGR02246 family)
MASDEQQIRDLIAKWMAATKTGDLATVLSLMTDDVVFLVAGQAPFGKERFAELMKVPPGASRPQIDGRSEIQEIQVLGEWAFVRTRLNVEMTPAGGRTVQRSGHTLSLFRKADGHWRLARDANLLLPMG